MATTSNRRLSYEIVGNALAETIEDTQVTVQPVHDETIWRDGVLTYVVEVRRFAAADGRLLCAIVDSDDPRDGIEHWSLWGEPCADEREAREIARSMIAERKAAFDHRGVLLDALDAETLVRSGEVLP